MAIAKWPAGWVGSAVKAFGNVFLASLGLSLMFSGCAKENAPKDSAPLAERRVSAVATTGGSGRVFAQGQLLPANGIVKIMASPGDVVLEMPVEVGSVVKSGQILAVLRSQAVFTARRAALVEQRSVAEREQAIAVRQAELQSSAAAMKLRHAKIQQAALREQESLLRLGEKQVQTADSILTSLKRVANDSLTREFVGKLEVERQGILVEDSRLKLAEQKAAYDRSQLEVELALEVAQQEVEAAAAMLENARQSDATRLFNLQIAALDSEAAQSTLTAPFDAVILSLGATIGGSVLQAPLVELASLESIVCEAEVNVADVGRIAIGQKATIRSRALDGKELTGVVVDKSRLVGRPRLRSLDPLAAADFRTVVVMVQVNDPAWASQWLQLQVEIVFEP